MPSSKATQQVASKKAPAKKVANKKSAAKKASSKKVEQEIDNSTDADAMTISRRRGERREGNPEATDIGAMKTPRRKKQRRRHIDPTTCERDYNNEEIEFMRAMDDYKHNSGRMFPTCSEVLEVIRGLGYVRLSEEQAALLQVNEIVEECEEAVEGFDDEEADEFDEAFNA